MCLDFYITLEFLSAVLISYTLQTGEKIEHVNFCFPNHTLKACLAFIKNNKKNAKYHLVWPGNCVPHSFWEAQPAKAGVPQVTLSPRALPGASLPLGVFRGGKAQAEIFASLWSWGRTVVEKQALSKRGTVCWVAGYFLVEMYLFLAMVHLNSCCPELCRIWSREAQFQQKS